MTSPHHWTYSCLIIHLKPPAKILYLVAYQQFSNSTRCKGVIICCFPFPSKGLTQIRGRTNSCCNLFINMGNCVLHNSSWWISCCDCSSFYCVFRSLYCHFRGIWWMLLDATDYGGLLLPTILKTCLWATFLQLAFAHLQLIVFYFFIPSVQKALMAYHFTSFS